jgi:hypothetical protein
MNNDAITANANFFIDYLILELRNTTDKVASKRATPLKIEPVRCDYTIAGGARSREMLDTL